MRIAISGGTGFIGGHLIDYFIRRGHEVIIVSRSCSMKNTSHRVQCVTWEELDQQSSLLEGLDAVINLAGESINQRWTEAAKKRILNSRIEVTQRISRFIAQLQQKPKVVINGSGMSVYGTSLTEIYDEESPHRIEDFLSSVVEEWEKAADDIQATRVVKLRIGMVLGGSGGALPKMALPYKLGVGGKVGSGQQWFSWIHIEDMLKLIHYCMEHEEISGPVNATAPNPVTNDQFGRTLGKVLKRPHLFPVPSFVLKLIFGEMSELLLKGQRVLPKALLNHGFVFTYPTIEEALNEIYTKN